MQEQPVLLTTDHLPSPVSSLLLPWTPDLHLSAGFSIQHNGLLTSWMQLAPSPKDQPNPLLTSLLPGLIWHFLFTQTTDALFFRNYHFSHSFPPSKPPFARVCVCVCVFLNITCSTLIITYLYVCFTNDLLALDNHFSVEYHLFHCQGIPQLPRVLCVEIRPRGLFSSTVSCPTVSSILSSDLVGHVGETLRV